MSEKKDVPFCPWCGAKMEHLTRELFYLPDKPVHHYYECIRESCCCDSPVCKTEEEAYKAAMTRYATPNRVLTWEEVIEACKASEWEILWRERKNGELDQVFPTYVSNAGWAVFTFPRTEEEVHYEELDYCKGFRCWSHKPTNYEMISTAWEASK